MRVKPWRLWGLADVRLDVALTAVAVAGLLWSRFFLLASGPWEWDETLFARGMLHFEMAAHFPHPPGFPGWLAVGRLMLPLAGEPLIALQWASAAASVLCLWPLAALGRRVAQPPVAVAAALGVLFLPGPWLFAVRGFSSTAAAFLAFSAGAVWVGGLAGRRATAFTLLSVGAFLVRPIILPALAVLWLGGVWSVRPRRRLVPGLLVGGGAIVLALAVMAWLEGGVAAYLRPIVTHAGRHAARLHLNSGGAGDLGIVKGVGGIAPACLLGLVALVGVVAWGRRVGSRAAVVWLVILAAAIGPLLVLQNRTYARYAVPVQMVMAPLAAGAAASLPLPAAVTGLLVAGALSAGWAFPLLKEQHETRLAAWEATLAAESLARRNDWAVVVEPEVHPFASYRWHVIERAGGTAPPLVLSPRAPEPWAGLDRPWVVATVHPRLYHPSLSAREAAWGGVSDRLQPLTQQRFLNAAMIENPPLPIGTWWSRESLEDGTSFMWAGPDAELWLPPMPEGTWIGLDVRPAIGDEPLFVVLDEGQEHIVPGGAERQWLWFLKSGSRSRPVVLRLSRARGFTAGHGDERELSAQVFDVSVRPRGEGFGGPVASSAERGALRLSCDGCYGAEVFGEAGRGVWLEAAARLRLALDEPGRLTLRFLAPRASPPNTVIRIAGKRVAGPQDISGNPVVVTLDIGVTDLADRAVELVIASDPLVPAHTGEGADSRRLGVVLLGLEFQPAASPAAGWWSG